MPGYVIAEVTVTHPEEYARYREMVPPTVAKYGGRFVVRGGKTETVEGEWAPTRLVVIEFESAARARVVGKRGVPRGQSAAPAHRAVERAHRRGGLSPT